MQASTGICLHLRVDAFDVSIGRCFSLFCHSYDASTCICFSRVVPAIFSYLTNQSLFPGSHRPPANADDLGYHLFLDDAVYDPVGLMGGYGPISSAFRLPCRSFAQLLELVPSDRPPEPGDEPDERQEKPGDAVVPHRDHFLYDRTAAFLLKRNALDDREVPLPTLP